MQYEYRVIAAPRRAEKQRGLKTTADRFAHGLTSVMNELAADGWEYLRADTLPCDERSGFTSTTTTYQAVLVFRRARSIQTSRQTVAIDMPEDGPRIELRAERGDAGDVPVAVRKLGPAERSVGDDLAAE